FVMNSPQQIVLQLAKGGQGEAALQIARPMLRLFDANGQIGSLYRRQMYEYHLPRLTTALTSGAGLAALGLFCDLLHDAAVISGRIKSDPSSDHSGLTQQEIANDEMAKYDVYFALAVAVRNSAAQLIGANP